jgi:hypothetical protein
MQLTFRAHKNRLWGGFCVEVKWRGIFNVGSEAVFVKTAEPYFGATLKTASKSRECVILVVRTAKSPRNATLFTRIRVFCASASIHGESAEWQT